MKKLITIAILLLSLTSSAQKFEDLFDVDTLDATTYQFENKKISLFVNKDNNLDTIAVSPILMYYKEYFDEYGIILSGFWVSKWIHEPISIFFNGKEVKMSECQFSKTENYPSNNVYTCPVTDSKTFSGISDRVVIGNKTYVAIQGSRGLISAKITGFKKVTCDWYE